MPAVEVLFLHPSMKKAAIGGYHLGGRGLNTEDRWQVVEMMVSVGVLLLFDPWYLRCSKLQTLSPET